MRKLLLLPILPILLFSCVTSTKLTSNTEAYKATTAKPFDEVWANIIDIFSARGYSIKTIDKTSGLIVTDDYSLSKSYTYEKNGVPIDPQAYVVVSKYSNVNFSFKNIEPDNVLGNFNVRVRKNGDNVDVFINLVNLRAVSIGRYGTHQYEVKTTGIFEKQLGKEIM